MLYRVIDLSTEIVDDIELPIIAGAHHVTPQISGFYTAHSNITIGRYGKFHPTYAVIYKDDSNTWLVGAQTNSILDIMGSGESLDALVDSDPGDWNYYRCAYEDSETIERNRIFRNVTGLNKATLVLMSRANPQALPNVPFAVHAMKATAPCFCSRFNPLEIESLTRVYGELL